MQGPIGGCGACLAPPAAAAALAPPAPHAPLPARHPDPQMTHANVGSLLVFDPSKLHLVSGRGGRAGRRALCLRAPMLRRGGPQTLAAPRPTSPPLRLILSTLHALRLPHRSSAAWTRCATPARTLWWASSRSAVGAGCCVWVLVCYTWLVGCCPPHIIIAACHCEQP